MISVLFGMLLNVGLFSYFMKEVVKDFKKKKYGVTLFSLFLGCNNAFVACITYKEKQYFIMLHLIKDFITLNPFG